MHIRNIRLMSVGIRLPRVPSAPAPVFFCRIGPGVCWTGRKPFYMVALSWCVFEFYLGVIWECLGKQILALLSLFTVVALSCMSTIFAVAAAAVQRADLGSPFAGEKCLLCGMMAQSKRSWWQHSKFHNATYATTQNMHVSCWCHASSHHQQLCLSCAALLCKIAEAAMITERWHNPNDHGGSNPNVNNCAARASHTISWFHHCWTACIRQHTWFRRARLYWMVPQSKRSNPMWSWCAYTGSPNVRCSSMGGSFAFFDRRYSTASSKSM